MPADDEKSWSLAGVELQVGDALLMLGHGELSELIAWCSDSNYSHAAIVAKPIPDINRPRVSDVSREALKNREFRA